MSILARALTQIIMAVFDEAVRGTKAHLAAERQKAEKRSSAPAEEPSAPKRPGTNRSSRASTPKPRPLEMSFARDHPIVRSCVDPSVADITLNRLTPPKKERAREQFAAAQDWPFFLHLPTELRNRVKAAAARLNEPEGTTPSRPTPRPAKQDTSAQGKRAQNAARGKARRKRTTPHGDLPERAIDQHWYWLRRNLRQAVTRNKYGIMTSDTRRQVFDAFLEDVGAPASSSASRSTLYRSVVRRLLEDDQSAARMGLSPKHAPAASREFEVWVANQLQVLGWKARRVEGGSNTGVAVIAVKSGIQIGIQCKRWKRVVGQTAVQDVFACTQRLGVPNGAIVATSGFAKSAERLGRANGILLLAVEDLVNIEEML